MLRFSISDEFSGRHNLKFGMLTQTMERQKERQPWTNKKSIIENTRSASSALTSTNYLLNIMTKPNKN